ncbi:calcyphosin-like protein [Cimex lectularius]|uniref:EF-hand domain-containing protein n=1 Tax=Cimex lectularius TaxID=79782 RepID=A0A8I6SBE0_CIMLE|nr:calcyphosin-like protein [Cimex lectularius]XP_014260323.1 calcyphosin-like protein [Cimex lectularius]
MDEMIKCRRMTKYEQATRPQSAASRQETEMMNKSKREAAVTKDALEKVRLLCQSRGTTGFLEFGRALRKGTTENMNLEDFEKGMAEAGVQLDKDEVAELFEKLDKSGSGTVTLNDVISAVMPKLPESRVKTISDAFDKLDKGNEGAITIDGMRGLYSVKKNTKFLSGEETEEEIKQKFCSIFEKGMSSGKISREEFFHYYYGISASIESDIHFDLMMRQTYKL